MRTQSPQSRAHRNGSIGLLAIAARADSSAAKDSRQGTPFRRALGGIPSSRLGRSRPRISGRTAARSRYAPEELESVRDALVAFSENKAAQEFVAKTLADHRARRETSHLHARHDRRHQAEGAAGVLDRARSQNLIDSPRANVRTRTVELIRSRAVPGFNEQLQTIASDPKTPDQLRVTALDILVARRSNLTSDQYAFLTSRLSPQSDAVMRQTAARIIGRSTPDRQQLLPIAREHLPKADPLTLSTILDCFRTSKDEEVGRRWWLCCRNRHPFWVLSAKSG